MAVNGAQGVLSPSSCDMLTQEREVLYRGSALETKAGMQVRVPSIVSSSGLSRAICKAKAVGNAGGRISPWCAMSTIT